MVTRRARSPRKAPSTGPSANAQRGEHILKLSGVDYLLRPSHQAIVAIEEQTGATLLTLVRDGNVGALSQGDLGIIAAQLIRAGAKADDELTRNVGADRLAQMIYEHGVASATIRLTLCLADAANGGRTASGEAKATSA
ncbi:hypothetical protein BH10PSE14_BH10PSE14_04340 [soil metagenome]